ncbi:hypothetical protein [Jannaschia pohangensis]|uniref:Relaxase/Mobilisation nuclease domain-containing protein n=1 Tax=Jannaschia pohangensis TaxID=390807 RepID=A0A1I3PYH7_9RHOB|nr:hypothetical protein [Jannaschia pohangensis]SFJ26455.1 hypothetical protein SAMN04488095_2345 [Jannaschia pohangensis]
MILVWSRHTGGTARRVIGYLLDETVPVVIGGRRDRIARDPAPEILRGDPRIVARTIDILETERRYRCATLSFAKNEVDIEKWRRRDRETLRRIDAAIELWMETAHSGFAPEARPPVLVSTHLHTGRLEINILVPACVMVPTASGRRIPRAFNPHPPVAASRVAWAAFEDTLNGAFSWHDPRDPRNAAAVRGPSWLERRAAALGRWIEARRGQGDDREDGRLDPREGARLDQEDARPRLLLAAKSIARGGATDRAGLLDGLAPMLDDLGWQVGGLRDDAIVLAPKDGAEGTPLIFHGTLCDAAPTPPDPMVLAAREQVLAAALERLRAAWTARAAENARVYGPDITRPSDLVDPAAILRVPAAPVLSAGLTLRRLAERLFDRIAHVAGYDAVTHALAGWAAGGGFDKVRRSLAALAAMSPIPRPKRVGTEVEGPTLPNHDDGPAP